MSHKGGVYRHRDEGLVIRAARRRSVALTVLVFSPSPPPSPPPPPPSGSVRTSRTDAIRGTVFGLVVS